MCRCVMCSSVSGDEWVQVTSDDGGSLGVCRCVMCSSVSGDEWVQVTSDDVQLIEW